MKNFISCHLFLFLSLGACFACNRENEEIEEYYPYANQIDTILCEGLLRTYKLYVPASYSESSKVALVIALHGYGNNATEMEKTTRLDAKADTEGFIVAYPDGWNYSKTSNKTQIWNAGGGYGEITQGTDDVGFINQMIELIGKHYNIDQSMIYATGFSNGSSMCYRLGCELSCKIAAIATHSGNLTCNWNNEPDCKFSILHIHGLKDGIVPFYREAETTISSPVDTVLSRFASLFSCDRISDTIFRNSGYLVKNWACSENIGIELYLLNEGRHDWFNSSNSCIQVNDIIWEFFKAHPKTD